MCIFTAQNFSPMKRRKTIQPITRFEIDIYDSKIYVIFGDHTGIDKRLKKDKYEAYMVDNILSDIHGCKADRSVAGSLLTITTLYPDYIIYLPDTKAKDKDLVETIAHEAIHICARIFTRIGASISKDSDECFAYLHGYIMRKTLDVIYE
jgi:hypothetical protein